MVTSVITRFAPSPTGHFHLGLARTALFNWLVARRSGGRFLLRMEDTDPDKYQPESEREIVEGLGWLGLDWDGEIRHQSGGNAEHLAYAEKLIEAGAAYRDSESCIRLRPPQDAITWTDLVRHEVRVSPDSCRKVRAKRQEGDDGTEGALQGDQDFIIVNSGGRATFYLANAIDDVLQGVTHVLRGEEHIAPTTALQIHILRALGLPVPAYAHLPFVTDSKGAKYSKRYAATSVLDWRSRGYSRFAMLVFLMHLGWGPRIPEGRDRTEFLVEVVHGQGGEADLTQGLLRVAELFALEDVPARTCSYDEDILNAINKRVVQRSSADELLAEARVFLSANGWQAHAEDPAWLTRVLDLSRPRMRRLQDIAFFFDRSFAISGAARLLKAELLARPVSEVVAKRLASTRSFSVHSIQRACERASDELQLEHSRIVRIVRAAVCGLRVTPGIYETMELLGRDETLARLHAVR